MACLKGARYESSPRVEKAVESRPALQPLQYDYLFRHRFALTPWAGQFSLRDRQTNKSAALSCR